MIDITGLREDKRPQSSTIVHALLDRLEAAEKERDALKAKIERMEKMEVALRQHHNNKMGEGFDLSHPLIALRVSAYQASGLYTKTVAALGDSK